MQSLRRQLKRGNACICINPVTKEVYVSTKKHSPTIRNIFNGFMAKQFERDYRLYRSIEAEMRYIENVINPIVKTERR